MHKSQASNFCIVAPNIFVSSVWIIFKLIYKQWDGRAWTGLIWLRIGKVGGLSGSDPGVS